MNYRAPALLAALWRAGVTVRPDRSGYPRPQRRKSQVDPALWAALRREEDGVRCLISAACWVCDCGCDAGEPAPPEGWTEEHLAEALALALALAAAGGDPRGVVGCARRAVSEAISAAERTGRPFDQVWCWRLDEGCAPSAPPGARA